MDKRTLIAIVLASAILMGWQILVLKPQEDARRAWVAAQDSTHAAAAAAALAQSPETGTSPAAAPLGVDSLSAAAAEPGGAAPATSSPSPLPSSAPTREVRIETDMMRATIATRGARVQSLSLPAFPSHRGGAVDLVHDGAPAFGLTLHTRDGDLPLHSFVFSSRDTAVSLTQGEERTIVFEGEPAPGLRVTKRFVVKGGSYDWTLGIDIARGPGAPAVHAYTVDLGGGLALTEENEEQDRTFVAGAIREETKLHRKKLGQMKKAEDYLAWNGRIRWASVMNKYFIVGLGPTNSPPLEVLIRPSSDAQRLGLEVKVPNLTGLGSEAAAGSAGSAPAPASAAVDAGAWSTSIAIYSGPQEIRSLGASPLHLDEAIDYGWAIIQPISQLLLRGLKLLYDLIPNYGVAIILISALTKLAFYKLSHQSIKSMKDMKKVQGELEELRKRFKNDAQRLNQETMALYKKHGVNPMAGCMPMLLQTPVFIALYNVLNRTIELRGAPFMLWIDDLSAPDALAKLPFALPFIGSNISALPIVMGAATFLQQKMTSIDPRQMALLYIMPVFMTVIFFNFPSGLVLYWLINTVLTIAQQYYIERKERVPAGALATSRAT